MKSRNAKWEYLIAEMRRLGPENEPEMVDWGPDVGAESLMTMRIRAVKSRWMTC